MDDQLYRFALQGGNEELVEAARYFEAGSAPNDDRAPRYDRAVLLYSKAGLLDTALDLASRYCSLKVYPSFVPIIFTDSQ